MQQVCQQDLGFRWWLVGAARRESHFQEKPLFHQGQDCFYITSNTWYNFKSRYSIHTSATAWFPDKNICAIIMQNIRDKFCFYCYCWGLQFKYASFCPYRLIQGKYIEILFYQEIKLFFPKMLTSGINKFWSTLFYCTAGMRTSTPASSLLLSLIAFLSKLSPPFL